MKILIAEDEARLAQTLRKGLTEQSFTVDVAADGEEALFMAEEGRYDVIILDVGLPQKDGFEVLKGLRKKGLSTPVLFLTAKDSVNDRVTGLNLGADDYVVKPFAFSELLARIFAISRRRQPYQDAELSAGGLTLNTGTREVRRGGQKLDLRPKEFAILRYLLENRGRVVTRTMLMEHVWDYSFSSGSNVVDVHVKRLREKIDAGFPEKLIRTVKGVGYVID